MNPSERRVRYAAAGVVLAAAVAGASCLRAEEASQNVNHVVTGSSEPSPDFSFVPKHDAEHPLNNIQSLAFNAGNAIVERNKVDDFFFQLLAPDLRASLQSTSAEGQKKKAAFEERFMEWKYCKGAMKDATASITTNGKFKEVTFIFHLPPDQQCVGERVVNGQRVFTDVHTSITIIEQYDEASGYYGVVDFK